MKVSVSSIFDCNAKKLFAEIKKTKSLMYVARPLIKFSLSRGDLKAEWTDGKYLFSMYFLSFFPIGKQWIVISVDDKNMRIRDNGYSKLISKWNHIISVEEINEEHRVCIPIR